MRWDGLSSAPPVGMEQCYEGYAEEERASRGTMNLLRVWGAGEVTGLQHRYSRGLEEGWDITWKGPQREKTNALQPGNSGQSMGSQQEYQRVWKKTL